MRKYMLSPNGTILETHPSIWLWMTISLLVNSWIQLLLGTDRLSIKITLTFEVSMLLAFMEENRKPLACILAYVILSFLSNGVIEYTEEFLITYRHSAPAVEQNHSVEQAPTIEHMPTPEDVISVYEFFDCDVVRELPWTRKEFPLGSSDYTFIFAESNEFFCRWFTLWKPSTVEISVTKDDDVLLRDNDDWTISLVQNERVLYSGTVNRLDEEKVFNYELFRGTYILVIERNTGNKGIRRIQVASRYE